MAAPPPTFSLAEDDPQTLLAFFHKHGFLVVRDGLDAATVAALRRDLHALEPRPGAPTTRRDRKNATKHTMHKRFFEQSPAMVDLVKHGAVVDLVQRILGDVPGGRGNGLRAHLIHNNAFSVPPGGRGQAPVWHTDDALQSVVLPEGVTLPAEARLPVLALTCMCWLSDCPTAAHGPTWVVPGSHRSGRPVDPELADRLGVPACGPAGTVVLVNNQVWHRGCANTSEVPRVTMQATFARRMIGHKFGTIMDYRLPTHVTSALVTDQDKERFGFLQGGAYS